MEVIYTTKRVEEYILNLEDEHFIRLQRVIDLLGKYGHELGMPVSKSLGGKLFELRVIGSYQIRAIYCFHEGRAYILHCFVKKSFQIPKKDMDYAQKIFRSLLA